MAFTYIDLLTDVIPFKIYDPITFTPQMSVDNDFQPLLIYTAAYDEDNIGISKWPFHKRTDGYISGTTIDETSAVMGSVLITCLWNRNMRKIYETVSDATTGVWTVYGLDPDDAYGYTIVAQDPTTGVVYNTVSYDKIIPAEPA